MPKKNRKSNSVKRNTVKRKSAKRKSKNTKGKKQKGGKLNAFFKQMLDARKQDLAEFEYNGNKYKQFTAKTGLKMYKKA